MRSAKAGLFWFAAMVGGWICFAALLLFSEPTLGDIWEWIRGLPLLVEGLVWLAAFPFVFALGIWESSWGAGLRVALVGCCAVGWSLAFWPGTWDRGPQERRPTRRRATPSHRSGR